MDRAKDHPNRRAVFSLKQKSNPLAIRVAENLQAGWLDLHHSSSTTPLIDAKAHDAVAQVNRLSTPASERAFSCLDPAMAAENYQSIMDHIFRFEGGYVDHPKDPGSATNMGITIGTLRAYRGGTTVTKDDVRGLSKAEAMEIYRRNYWNAICGDELPSGVDLCTMDSAVNSGPSRGVRWLQRAVGAASDGKLGAQTLSRAEAADPRTTVERMCDDRLAFLKGLSTWGTFGKGWSSRVASVRSLALQLVDEPERVSPVEAAPVPTPKPAPAGGPTSKATGGMIGAGLPNVVLLLLVKLGAIPADVANDPETVLLLTTLLTAAGGWLGSYLAPRNATA